MAAPVEADRYEALDIIGKGSFGIIRRVRRKSDGQILCRKEISYRSMKPKERDQLQAELSILKGLRHPNIVQYLEREHLRSSADLHIYMEYCEQGDLARKIRNMKAKNEMAQEDFVWGVFAQLVCGLYRCHKGQDPPEIGGNVIGLGSDASPSSINSRNVVLHRDLKPENIFLGADSSVKIGDFGLSKIIASHDFASTYVGTPFYMSPEICAAESYGWASDIWALGCVIYELCAKEPPFNGRTHMELIQNIRLGRVKALPSLYSKELQEVVMQCIRVKQTTRPDTAMLLNLPMVKLKRKELGLVDLSHEMHTRIEQASRKEKELDQKLAREGDNLRREWEVKARLEIDRQVEKARTHLEREFDAKVKLALQQELAKIQKEQALREPRPQSGGIERSSTPDNAPDDQFLDPVLEELCLNSPTTSRSRLVKKSSRTPFTRARTMVEASPMDLDMTGPVSVEAPIANLGLSPRHLNNRPHSSASTGRVRGNIFKSANSDRSSPATSGSAAADDSGSEDEGFTLPSPTKQPRDTFPRPRLKRLSTMPAKQPRPNSALFSTRPGSPNKSKENLDPEVETASLPMTKPSKLPARPPASPTKDLRGHSLVDLSRATIWDPERDEMPSPFLQRKGRPPLKGHRGGPGFSHLR